MRHNRRTWLKQVSIRAVVLRKQFTSTSLLARTRRRSLANDYIATEDSQFCTHFKRLHCCPDVASRTMTLLAALKGDTRPRTLERASFIGEVFVISWETLFAFNRSEVDAYLNVQGSVAEPKLATSPHGASRRAKKDHFLSTSRKK